MINQIISHYKILSKLGEGGMGIVYKVHDNTLDRDVALKFLPHYLISDSTEKERFHQEARAAAALTHPNIAVVYEIGEHEGQIFIAMEYVEGQTLKEVAIKESLSINKVLDFAIQICEGLVAAHEKGIVHRDIKSENIIVTPKGQVKIMDFGLAKVKGATKITKTGSTLGTAAYMSPEQARGEEVDQRTDIWSMGIVLYQILTGRLPFRGEHEAAMIYSIVHEEYEPILNLRSDTPVGLVEIINKMLRKDLSERYQTSISVAQVLQGLIVEKKELVTSRRILKKLKKPAIAIPVIVTLCALVAISIWFFNHQDSLIRAREELLPQAANLYQEDILNNIPQAYRLAESAEEYIAGDSALVELFSKIAVPIRISTEPQGAKIFMKDYVASESSWKYVGISPIEKARIPRRSAVEWKIEKEGYETVRAATFSEAPDSLLRTLDVEGTLPLGMVRVRAVDSVQGIGPVDDFLIDRFEVTNKDFKKFVSDGGYQKKEYWKQPFIKDGEAIPWETIVKEFVDQTGRPGPATWQAGDFPTGQENFPVSGISWYEAAAFAEYAGKTLPTMYHWGIARGVYTGFISNQMISGIMMPLCNFKGIGPDPVGTNKAISAYGIYDMAGNVREWCWNESPKGRIIRGGAWNDVPYMFGNLSQASPFDRSPKNGFRCASYIAPERIPVKVFEKIDMEEMKDFYKVKPVSDAIFQVYKEQFSYDRGRLDPQIEWRNDSADTWIEEKVSYNAAYENERVTAYLFLPRNSSPPYQTVIYFPGSGAVQQRSSKNFVKSWDFKQNGLFYLKNGRALFVPIYKGTYERGSDELEAIHGGDTTYEYSIFFAKIVKDFKRSIDYLETRPDIDCSNLVYFGFSWGGRYGAIIPAVENRLKVSILEVGGIWHITRQEVNEVNYISRVKLPTLMLNGKYDATFPYETSVKPMFDLLGTPKADKRLVLYETDHFIPRNEMIKEILSWLDKYLGPVNR